MTKLWQVAIAELVSSRWSSPFGRVCADSKKKDSQEGKLNEFVMQKAIKRYHYQF